MVWAEGEEVPDDAAWGHNADAEEEAAPGEEPVCRIWHIQDADSQYDHWALHIHTEHNSVHGDGDVEEVVVTAAQAQSRNQ